MAAVPALLITVELEWSDGPKRYDEDDVPEIVQSELDGNVVYVNSANGEDETGLRLNVTSVQWVTP